ncbi:S-adenosylmethionine mitochondrial carrier protein isoform X2 [Electrophorus electricus]|uniref:Mitochondrial S-adenosylmethionine carrier protein n=1 Tax=Electrophorus electricus TaxID=8005 RepID=A0AAY5EGJ6_ELEEL|nr:S-adenosylmethionine mitochondrial carrier protein isoform X2 [Electrophorus electricus]
MQARDFAASLVAGGCAGMCVDLTLFPLDTIKTRLQSPQGFYRAGGFGGVYAGVPSAAVGSFPNAAAFFVTYEGTKSLLAGCLSGRMAPVTHMLAASLGEIVACLIRVPTEVVKQRTQASPVLHTHHVLMATLREEIPFSLVQFPLWEYLKTLWRRRQGTQLDSWQAAVCGAVAGAIAAFVTTPLDVAKTRIILSKAGTATARGNIPLVLYEVWKRRGLPGLFAGSIPRMAFISVGGFIFLGAYEKVRHTLL